VPTWNYQTIHLKGKLSFDYSKKSKLRAVGVLTKLYENMYFGEKGWKMSDASKDYIDQSLKDVVAFKLEVNNILGKSKLNQNRGIQDFISVKENMKKQNKNYLFESMSNKKNE
jgi:transcriptional regulator